MATMQAKCPVHGEWSDGKGSVKQEPTGLVWEYTFPCCTAVIEIRAARASSPATPDLPIIPTQRERQEF